MLWVKTLHVFFVMGLMAGVFYLPRILVNLAEAQALGEPLQRLEGMGRRLFRFCGGLGLLAVAAGLWLWLVDGVDGAWLYWKLFFVALLAVYYCLCGRWLAQLRCGICTHPPIFFRIYNELSLLLVVPILIFAIVKIG